MLTSVRSLLAATVLAGAALSSAPAMAQDADDTLGPITISGTIGLVSDYRFRGVSQTDEEMAVQGGISATHESGVYVGTWASNLAGWGTFGGSNMELDLYGGYAMALGDATVDVGLTWYMYPGGADNTDFAEPYVKISSIFGPVEGLVGVAYAPKQQALGNYSGTPYSRGQKEDNLYVWTDISSGIPNTPITVKGHLGYSNGNPGLGPNGTSLSPTGEYFDWLLGADVAVGPLTLGVSWVDTNITRRESAYLGSGFANSKNGSTIAGSQVVFSVGAGF